MLPENSKESMVFVNGAFGKRKRASLQSWGRQDMDLLQQKEGGKYTKERARDDI